MDQGYRKSRQIIILGALFDSSRMLIGAIHSFFLLQRGVSLPDLAYLQIVYAVSALVFEFPTGLYAVKFGNKASLTLSCLFSGLFYFLVLFAPNLTLLSLSEISYALGLAFSSGALESWWMGELSEESQLSSKIAHLTYLRTEMTSLGNIFSGLAGALIATYVNNGFVYVYLISAAAMFFLMFMFQIRQEHSQIRIQTNSPILSWLYIVNMLVFCFKTRVGLIFISISCTISVAVQLIYHYWQPYFLALAKEGTLSTLFPSDAMLLGIVFAAYTGLKYVVNRYIRKRLLHVLDPILIGCICALLAAALIALTPWFARYQILMGVACFAMFHSCLSIVWNTTNAKFYPTLDNERSAGIISGANIFSRLAGIVSLSIIAATVSTISLEMMFSLLSLPFMFICLLLASLRALR